MSTTQYMNIGTPGIKWGDEEKKQWLAQQSIKRSYQDSVVSKIEQIKSDYNVEQYGALSYDVERYPLFVFKSNNWNDSLPTVLITGGVHGYETSGVHGALAFLEHHGHRYTDKVNLVAVPCVSPWGYETINRWNPKAIDPNRSFVSNSPAEESALLMQVIEKLNIKILMHIDLHETTDTDNTEFRPALAARDASVHDNWNIPDGFYLVGDTNKPQAEFQRAIIESVEKVTHIAPADENNCLIGAPLEQFGVINYDTEGLGLCAGVAKAEYRTTTEVYPDSPLVDDKNCVDAQVAAVKAAIDFVLNLK